MKNTHSIFLFIVIIIISSCDSEKGTEYKLFYLGGQSNMDGCGKNVT